MQHYIEHVYSGSLPTHSLKTGNFTEHDSNEHYNSLARLYVLGERVLNAKCQNAIIREIFRISKLQCEASDRSMFPDSQAITIICQGTTPESPARRLTVDFAVCHSNEAWFEDIDDHGYLLDFSKALVRKVEDQKSVRDFRDVTLKAKNYFVIKEN